MGPAKYMLMGADDVLAIPCEQKTEQSIGTDRDGDVSMIDVTSQSDKSIPNLYE